MSKVITTYRIDLDVKRDLKMLTVNEDMDNISDMLRTLIDFYKINKHQEAINECKTS